GTAAISSAKLAYQIYSEVFSAKRYLQLADQGARTQRLLWASTGTKNPKYSDVKYIEPLIGAQTINTIPLETLTAYRDHGKPQSTLTDDVREAQSNLEHLQTFGIDLDAITRQLEKEGVEKFINAYDLLLKAITQKASQYLLKGVA
ncbi:MAG: transaldolase, partial [Ignavibacteriae bacterium]